MKRVMRNLSILSLLVLFILVAGLSAAGNELSPKLFIPSVYSDRIPCHTVVKAGQSIQAAINNAKSGHTICVRAGTYHERVSIGPSKSGITLKAYPGERPILDGQHSLPAIEYQGLLHITGSNVVVDGFEVRDSAHRGVVVYQPNITSPPLENVTVRNLIITGSMDTGITVKGFLEARPRNVLIENNIIHNNLKKNAGGATGGSALAFIEARDSIARGNHVYHNLGEGLVADRWSTNITLEENVVYDNDKVNLYLVNAENPLVQRNLVFCTDDHAYWNGQGNTARAGDGLQVRDESFPGLQIKPPPSSGQVIINNIVVGCGLNFGVSSQIPGGGLNDALVANNSFINARGDGYYYTVNVKFEGQASFANSQFINNLIWQSAPGVIASMWTDLGAPNLSTFTMANNLYSSQPGNNWPTNEIGRLIGDAKLLNPVFPVQGSLPDAHNYSILPNSPAVDAGRPVSQVTVDFFGHIRDGALDIGAIESTD